MIFVPSAGSDAVEKLRRALGTDRAAIEIPVLANYDAKERDCYANVRASVERDGGRMQHGWAVWQHAHLFIEAERHAVHAPGEGMQWLDRTPHTLPDGNQCATILFIANDDAMYDFDAPILRDNVRVPLVDDSRVSRALKMFSESTDVMNSVPGVNVALPAAVSKRVLQLQSRAALLLAEAMQPVRPTKAKKVGRNDPCPCGSGKKYKKCHGTT
jgi:SEC-C motif-containing protein